MPVRIAKRSQEACAISNVPELSCGFMVPMQKNGRGRAWRRLPTVTACSSIASSRPDCMRGVARLNSSRTTALANSGPGMNSSGRRLGLSDSISCPITAAELRSSVHWMRESWPPIARAMTLASVVLPTPGTSSTSRCPDASRQHRARDAGRSISTIALRISSQSACATSRASISTRSSNNCPIPLAFVPQGELSASRTGY